MSQIKKSDGNILNNLYGNNDTITSAFEKVKSVKNFLASLNLSSVKIKHNKIFMNDSHVVMTFINLYLRVKIINSILFSLFLICACTSFIYSIFHIKYEKQNISGRIGHIVTEASFTLSLVFIIILCIMNFHRFGLFNPTYYKGFLILFFIYTLSILLFRKYNKMIEDDENILFQFGFFYSFLILFVVSILGMFLFFSVLYLPFNEVQLCNFTDNSKLSIFYFAMFTFCLYVTANLVMTYL